MRESAREARSRCQRRRYEASIPAPRESDMHIERYAYIYERERARRRYCSLSVSEAPVSGLDTGAERERGAGIALSLC